MCSCHLQRVKRRKLEQKATLEEVTQASLPGGIRGRGASGNPRNRFEKLAYASELEGILESSHDEEDSRLAPARTIYLRDNAKTIITRNESPDIPFAASLNPYRGCEHGCIYCYARPTHEFVGFSAGLDFETRILVKENAPDLLRRELTSPRWQPQVIAMSGVTDCYQPVEKRLRLTRRCLEIMAEFRNPVAIVTKNQLVTRDLDVFSTMLPHRGIAVSVSLTTLDPELAATMEPRASRPSARLAAIRKLADAGICCGVLLSPIIPGLTDEEIGEILSAAAKAGARWAGYQPVRLPMVVGPLFEEWIHRASPGKAERVLNRIRAMHGGFLNDGRFCHRMQGAGEYAASIRALFESCRRKAGILGDRPDLSCEHFRRPEPNGQGVLF